MFHFGGMTLGYLAQAETTRDQREPAPASEERPGFLKTLFGKRKDERSEREREQEMARAFLTPWHLFY
ncbi:hypothetical protein SAMN05880582_109137 [Rhizobium sp. RU20A]|nr:hypothetical protein SAMN05880582_109137 [Rhizobium sp. RU20A]